MYRSLYFKIILIFVIFMVTVMAVVGTVLLVSVSNFYASEFVEQLDSGFSDDALLRSELIATMAGEDYPKLQMSLLESFATYLGLDTYRTAYILDMDGQVLASSQGDFFASYPEGILPETAGEQAAVAKTRNLLAAMSGEEGNEKTQGLSYVDYAVYLTNGQQESIVYIMDTQEDMLELSWDLFSIILQALLFGIVLAVVLSFFLAKAITRPIQSLTDGAQLIMAGEFEHEIDVHSEDEIGVLTSTFNDMKTVLKTTLDEVVNERTKLETVFSYLKDGVIAFGEKGRVIHINPYAAKLFDTANRTDFHLATMLSLLGVDMTEAKKPGTERSNSITFPEIKYSGRVYELSIGIFRYADAGEGSENTGEMRRGFITVLHDITSRYELDESRREFVANVSHELRTPLTGIKGAVETVRMSYDDMPIDMRDSFLDMAIEESDRMLRIIRDLLTLSRLDNNRTKWEVESFDLAATLRHIGEVIRPEVNEKGHEVSWDIAPLPIMTGDRERISQVIINILTNAVKYTPAGGQIRVTAAVEGENIRVSVADNGIGIPEEDLPRMFERFYRVEKSRTSDAGGTGLGLAIVKEIVEAHGGDVRIDSRVGEGTCVTVLLPIVTSLKGEESAAAYELPIPESAADVTGTPDEAYDDSELGGGYLDEQDP